MSSTKSKVVSETAFQVAESEGFSTHMYLCPGGHATIGFGYNLENGMTRDEATALMKVKLNHDYKVLTRRAPVFGAQTVTRQKVLLDMAYNMGVEGLMKFKKMWEALKVGDYITASNEMLDSKWHRDFVMWAHGNVEVTRSFKLSKIMRNSHG